MKPVEVILFHAGTPLMAQGLLGIADWLRRGGYEARIVNIFAESEAGDYPHPASRFRDGCIKVAAISLHWFYQIPETLKLLKGLKGADPSIRTVLGGFTATFFARQILEGYKDVDFVISGDGEIPLLLLLSELEEKRPLFSKVPNLSFRESGMVISNPVSFSASTPLLNSLDFSDLSLVENLTLSREASSYRRVSGGRFGRRPPFSTTFYLPAGRGCPVSCTFCGGGLPFQQDFCARGGIPCLKAERLIEMVDGAKGHGFTSFHASFDPFPKRRGWKGFLNLLKERGERLPLLFECWSLPDPEFLRLFKEVSPEGGIVLSPETSSEEVRFRNKGFFFRNLDFERTLESMERLHIAGEVYFGFFLPFDSEGGLERTLHYMEGLEERYGEGIDFRLHPYSTDPGSPIQRSPGSFGLSLKLETFEDYVRALEGERESPLSMNLMVHYPEGWGDGSRDTTKALSLRGHIMDMAGGGWAGGILKRGMGLPFWESLYRYLEEKGAIPEETSGSEEIIALLKEFVEKNGEGDV